jgi:DNA-binding MarR family transcriptional regulator
MPSARSETPSSRAARVPRWLDEEESRTWIAWLLSTRLLWDELERDLQRDASMPYSYYEVLVQLSETPSRSRRMSELADATQSSRSRLSHAVALAHLAAHPSERFEAGDRRGWLAVLTDEGFAAIEAAAPDHVESVRTHLFDLLTTEQQRQLREISDVFLDHLLPIISERDRSGAGRIQMARARLGRGDADSARDERKRGA